MSDGWRSTARIVSGSLSAVLVSGGLGGLGVYDPATDQFDLAPTVDTQIADLGDLEVLANNPATADILVVASDSRTSSVDVARARFTRTPRILTARGASP